MHDQADAAALLWRQPIDIASRSLYYGSGGKEQAPNTTYTFIKEDLDGTNAKLHVRDENGVRWRVKLGPEARPETTASRLVWAVGYSTNEFYFLPEIQVRGLPAQLHRGQNLVGPNGTMHNVEMRRQVKCEDKTGTWSWRHNSFKGTREFDGLRVMMALLNNWDVKDQNNAIYAVDCDGHRKEIYRVSDLGASFGSKGRRWTRAMSKDNLQAYKRSRLIRKVTSEYVDFDVPRLAALICVFELPEFVTRLRRRWIGQNIPRDHVRWIGALLAQLSPDQIRDAFRAGGYGSKEVEDYTQIVEQRIRELKEL